MKRRLAQVGAAALVLLSLPLGLQGVAHAANCGGQKALPRDVPYACHIPGHTIDGTHFSADVVATGHVVVVNYTLDAPRAIPTPVVIRHHVGKSGDGGVVDTASGTIPPGSTTIRLQDSVPCRDGQLDVKAVYTKPGDERGLVGGPWIRNGVGCDSPPVTPPTTPTPAAPPAVPPTIPAAPPGAPPVTPKRPTSPPPANRPPTSTPDRLPATGRDEGPALGAAVLMLAAGVALLILRGRKPIST